MGLNKRQRGKFCYLKNMLRRFALFVALLFPMVAFSQPLPPDFFSSTALGGLTEPVNIVSFPAPDTRMFVLERRGKVKMFDYSVRPGNDSIVLSLTNYLDSDERGLSSIALDPNFETNGYVYLYYTHSEGDGVGRNRISRFRFNGSVLLLGTETLVWEENEPVSACCHFGGGMDFGPDGMLYLATGDAFESLQAQDLTRSGGKIIRLNTANLNSVGPWERDADNLHIIPADNPASIMDGPGGNLDEIWAYGLRNPYRAHWDLVEERFYVGEVGGNVQSSATEDIHVGRAGANYGWPFCEGYCVPDPNGVVYDDPIHVVPHNSQNAAITAGVVYRGGVFPVAYDNVFFYADYTRGYIRYLVLGEDGEVLTDVPFGITQGAVVALENGHDGALYAVDYATGRVRRIEYDSGNVRPSITSVSSDVDSGAAPLSVTFTAVATDAENDPLTYQWFFSDGVDLVGDVVTRTFTEGGSYSAYVQVFDGNQVSFSEDIHVLVGSPPSVTITSPLDGSLFQALDTIAYDATVTHDSAVTLEWDIKFLHASHVHPSSISSAPNGSFTIADNGHDYSDFTGYSITLTATDDSGRSSSDEVSVFPDKVDISLSTTPLDFPISIDGNPREAPFVLDTMKGFKHVISVEESYCIDNVGYEFDSWSTSPSRLIVYTVPEADDALVANYTITGPCGDFPSAGLVAQFESDVGVLTSGPNVLAWQDLSGNGNDMDLVQGNPLVSFGATNGLPALDLDNTLDSMGRYAGLTGFSAGSADRTMFLVARYRGLGYGGLTYGSPMDNEAFGLVVDPTGNLGVQGYGVGNNFSTTTVGTDAGFLVQSVVLSGNNGTQYVNGVEVGSFTHTFDTMAESLVLNIEIDGEPSVSMNVAAAFIYNRALSPAERTQVEGYLQSKYLGVNQAPVAQADTATVQAEETVVINVLENDSDDGELALDSIAIAAGVVGGVATANADGTVSFTASAGTAGTDGSFSYTVDDDMGLTSNEVTVTVSITNPINDPPMAVADTAIAEVGTTIVINVLDNDTDDAGLIANTVVIENPAAAGLAVANADGTVSYTPNAGATEDVFEYSVEDAEGLKSNFATVSVGIFDPSAGPQVPQFGLVAHFESDSGIAVDGTGRVTGWADQSDEANDLLAAGDPQLISGALNGQDVIDFDGVGDALTNLSELNNFPNAAEDRTVYAVVNYEGFGWGGVSWGAPVPNQTFGLTVSPNAGPNPRGVLSIQGWGAGNDRKSTQVAVGAGWLVQSAVLNDNNLIHQLDGDQIAAFTATYDTDGEGAFVIGQEIGGAPQLDMQVAAVLVYDRALESVELAQLQAYLQDKYFNAVVNLPPVALADTADVDNSGTVVIDVLDNDSDETGVVATSVVIVGTPTSGTADVNTDGTVTYIHGGDSATQDTFTYTVQDALGLVSNVATVTVTIGDAVNAVPVALDDTATVTSGGTVVIDILGNDTDDGVLDPSSISVSGLAAGALSPLADGTFSYTNFAGSTLTEDTFTYTVADTLGAVSNEATVTITITDVVASPIPQTGLVAHFETDTGVTTDASGQVTNWFDQSSQANNLLPTGDPQLIEGALNGQDVIDLDGVGDALFKAAPLNALPEANEDRTVYAVVSYEGFGWGGIGWGAAAPNQTFGLVVSNNNGPVATRGALSIQGWGGGTFDRKSSETGVGAGWLVQSAVHDNGDLIHQLNGSQIDAFTSTYATGSDEFVIGREVGGTSTVDMQVAAVLVYDRALDGAELAQLQSYLQDKYFDTTVVNLPPVALADTSSVDNAGTVVIDILDNDSDETGVVATSVVIVDTPTSGTADVNTDGTVTYIHGGDTATQDTFTYTVQDDQGLTSNVATVTVTINGVINEAPVALDDTATVASGETVIIDALVNDTDDVGLLVTSVAVTSGVSAGTLVINTDGTLSYTHNDGPIATDSFTYTVNDAQGLTSNEATVAISITGVVGGPLVPQTGLVAHFETDTGVTLSGGQVTSWDDQSPQGNDLLTAGDPTLITDVLNGQSVIDLDGAGDVLVNAAALSAFPLGSDDRTVYAVVNYQGFGWGGVSWGAAAPNQTFGLVVSNNRGPANTRGSLSIQGWGGGTFDRRTTETGVGADWLVQSAVLNADALLHQLDGSQIDAFTSTYATASDEFVIGREVGGTSTVDMQVAAVLVYDRALDAAELAQLQNYLQDKYFGTTIVNQAPVALADNASVDNSGSVVIDILDNDTDDGGVVATSVVVTADPTSGTVELNADGTVTYTHGGDTSTQDTFSYTVADAQGLISNAATVTVAINNEVNPAPVASDDSATVASGGTVLIDLLVNDSDDGTLVASSIDIGPGLVAGALINNGDGTVSYSNLAGSTATQDTFTYTVEDNLGAVSNVATVTISVTGIVGDPDVPQSGLVAHFETDFGVNVVGGEVTGWTDQSGQGNNLVSAGDPTVIPNALNGQPVIDLDGSGDALLNAAALNSFPLGSDDRTVYSVVSYEGFGWGGVGWGAAAANQTFGLVVSNNNGPVNTRGALSIQGWGGGTFDRRTTETGVGAGWLVQSAVLNNNDLVHQLNGTQIDSFTSTYATASDEFVIGREVGGSSTVDMQVAAVLVYDRALDGAELAQLQSYLQDKYFDTTIVNLPPVALADTSSVDNAGTVVIDVLDNDSDETGVVATSVVIVDTPTSGTADVNTDGTVTYIHGGDTATQDTFTYTVQDDQGLTSNVATVTVTINGVGNEAPIAQADMATVLSGGTVIIDVLVNDSDDSGLVPTSVALQSGALSGSLEVLSDGTVSYINNGTGTQDSFTYTVQDDQGLTSNIASVTITIEGATALPVPESGLVAYFEADIGVTQSAGQVTGWADQSGQGNDLLSLGDPTLVAGAVNGAPAIDLDGVGDGFLNASALNAFPSGDQDRTVYTVVSYRDFGWGGVSWGAPSANQAFGLVVSNNVGPALARGSLSIQGWGGGAFDRKTIETGVGAGWVVQSAVMNSNAVVHQANGSQIDAYTASYNTATSGFIIGGEVDGSPPDMDMQVAAVIIYDRALTAAEQNQVQSYLQEKYFDGSTTLNQAPVANPDSASVEASGTVVIDILENDSDDVAVVPGSVQIVSSVTEGELLVGADGSVSYTNQTVGSTEDSFSYTVADAEGLVSNTATVDITITGTGTVNQAPVALGDEASVEAGESVVINILTNDSDDVGVDPSSVQIVTNVSTGELTIDTAGAVTYVSESGAATTESFTYTVADAEGLVSNIATVTITVTNTVPVNQAPVAVADNTSVLAGNTVVINVLGNDSDDSALAVGTVAITSGVSAGSLLVNADGTVSYTNTDGSVAEDTFAYTVDDDEGETSNTATVTIDIIDPGTGSSVPQFGLVAHYEADFGVAESGGLVTAWSDQSGQGNDLLAVGDPAIVFDTPSGEAAMDFDGTGDAFVNSAALNAFPLGDQDRTVYMVVSYESLGGGGFGYGSSDFNQAFGLSIANNGRLRVNAYGPTDKISTTAGTNAGWLIQSARVSSDQLVHSVNGVEIDSATRSYETAGNDFVLGADLDQDPALDMKVAALLVYDRALTSAEEESLQEYLDEKYLQTDIAVNQAPVAQDDDATVGANGTVLIDILANDSDDFGLAVNTVAVSSGPSDGTLALNTDGTVSYTHTGGTSTQDTFTYTVEDELGLVSNAVTVTITITGLVTEASVPQVGLVAHFETDSGVNVDGSGQVLGWTDQSGQGNDLLATGDPVLVAGSLNGEDVIDFDGNGDALLNTVGLNGFPLANQDRTVYMVVSYEGLGSGGLGYGSSALNQSFGLSINTPGNLRINAYGPNDKVSNTPGTDSGWLVQSATVSSGQLVHSVDGVEIDSATRTYETTGELLVLGADLDQSPAVDMQVAAFLVYDRALTAEEEQELQTYLQSKYF